MAATAQVSDHIAALQRLALIHVDPATAEALSAAIVALQATGPRRPLKGRRPRWWSDQLVRELVIASYREKTLDAVVAEAAALFGVGRAPSRSSVGRVWQRLDRGHLIKGAW